MASRPKLSRTPLTRKAGVERSTKETTISVGLDIDGTGRFDVATGIGFFDHMLEQLSRHSLIDLTVKATGDLHIDDHHTVEDTGIVIGQAIAKALGERRGIVRYASLDLAMDETLTRAAVDVSGRPYLIWKVEFPSQKIGSFDTEVLRTEGQVAVLPAGHPLSTRSRLTLAEAESIPDLPLPRWPRRDGTYGDGPGPEVRDTAQLLQLIALGRTTAVLPESCRGNLHRDLVAVDVPDAPIVTTVIAWPPHSRSRALAGLVLAATRL